MDRLRWVDSNARQRNAPNAKILPRILFAAKAGPCFVIGIKRFSQNVLQQAANQQVFEAQTIHEELTEAEQEELAVRQRRAEGTPCNKENFEAWNARFEAEVLAEKEEEEGGLVGDKNGGVDKSGRITGKAFFSGKAGNLEALELAAEQAEMDEDEENLEDLDEELFEDDVDLDDLDFDDDDDNDDLDDDDEEEIDI